MNVGQVIEPYDSDKLFPVYGFGGIPRYMGINAILHCFPINGNRADPKLHGI